MPWVCGANLPEDSPRALHSRHGRLYAGIDPRRLLSDGIGRKRTFLLSAVASIVLTLVYLFAPLSNDWFLPVGFVLGFVSLIMFSPIGPFMTELYSTAVRGVGQGSCCNAGRGIGAPFPALVGFLAAKVGLTTAIAMFSLSTYGIMIIVLLLPETRGSSLMSREHPAQS